MTALLKPVAEVKSIGTDACPKNVAEDLRALADAVESGRINMTSAIVCYSDLSGESLAYKRIGAALFMTQWIGLLESCKMGVFKESNP